MKTIILLLILTMNFPVNAEQTTQNEIVFKQEQERGKIDQLRHICIENLNIEKNQIVSTQDREKIKNCVLNKLKQ
jgi:hypothetical protein